MRCWGFGANGRLGYASTANVLSPASAPAVDLGPGRTATAITAGASHTCAILDNGSVRCWGNGVSGRLGYGNQLTVGDNESPAAAGPVDIGAGRRAVAISAGDFHTCAILDNGSLLCWGFGSGGQLGRGTSSDVGDDETPASAGPVNLGGHAVRAVSGGKGHTCAILDDGSARCWGFGADGRLGYGSEASITSAASAPSINLGPGRSAVAIAAGEAHSCAVLDNGSVRCWGFGGNGRLGYDAVASIGDGPGETPASAGPVAFGGGPHGSGHHGGLLALLRAARRRDPALLGLRRQRSPRLWQRGLHRRRPGPQRGGRRPRSGRRAGRPGRSPTSPSASRPPPCSSPSARRPRSPCASPTPGPTRRRASPSRCPRPRG